VIKRQKHTQTPARPRGRNIFYSLIQLSQFHLVNEGVRREGGGGLPFQQLQANNHIDTHVVVVVRGVVGSRSLNWNQCLVTSFTTGVMLLEPQLRRGRVCVFVL